MRVKLWKWLGPLTCLAALTLTGACGSSGDLGVAQVRQSQDSRHSEAIGRLLNEGVALAGQGKAAEAKATFEIVTELDGANALAWYNLGCLAQAGNEAEAAIAHYDRALAVDPGYTPAMFNKAILLEAGDQAAAIQLYQEILAINPSASTTHLRLGLLHAAKGDDKAARQGFDAAVKLDPSLRDAVPARYQVGAGG